MIDMNLSPEWQPLLEANGFEAVHWSAVGARNAPDREIMQWARDHRCVVFTHDVDFGILLAHSKDGGPSVVQVRTQDVTPSISAQSSCAHCGPTGRRWRPARC